MSDETRFTKPLEDDEDAPERQSHARVAMPPDPMVPPPQPERRTRPGMVLADKYELTERIGYGGMAEVWRAWTLGVDGFRREVAVKKILPNLVGQEELAKLFTEEARVVASLQHPNVVPIFDFGRDDLGQYFIVMEWVEGMDLGRWIIGHIKHGWPTPIPVVVRATLDVLRALACAHARINERRKPAPVFHRDVTPSNVLMSKWGAIKLGDFGISRAMDRMTMTTPGVVRGKLAYVAPELMTGERASAQSDLYAVGVVLYEALTKRRLFEGMSDLEIYVKAGKGEHTPVSATRDDVPPALVDVLEGLLAPRPAQRIGSAHEAIAALSAAVPAVHLEAVAQSLASLV